MAHPYSITYIVSELGDEKLKAVKWANNDKEAEKIFSTRCRKIKLSIKVIKVEKIK